MQGKKESKKDTYVYQEFHRILTSTSNQKLKLFKNKEKSRKSVLHTNKQTYLQYEILKQVTTTKKKPKQQTISEVGQLGARSSPKVFKQFDTNGELKKNNKKKKYKKQKQLITNNKTNLLDATSFIYIDKREYLMILKVIQNK